MPVTRADELDARSADTAKELLALADYLRHQNEHHSNSICAADPIIKNHIADLKRWEDLTRLSARQQASVEELARLIAEGCIEPSDFKVGGYPIFNVSDMALAKTAARALLAKYDIFEKAEG